MSERQLINTVFVVEGKNDADKLIKAGVPYVCLTEGTKVPRETLIHLQVLEKKHKIVILTDPDGPGNKISEKLQRVLTNYEVLVVEKKDTIKNKSVGIENVDQKVINNLISKYLKEKFTSVSDITYNDLVRLGLVGPSSKHKRLKVAERLNLIYTNAKKMHVQMRLLDIKKETLENIIYE